MPAKMPPRSNCSPVMWQNHSMDFDPKEPTTLQYKDGKPPVLFKNRDGSIKRYGRWAGFAVHGMRCKFCLQGILWIRAEKTRDRRKRGHHNDEGRRRITLAIEPGTWNGEEWYLKGIHRWHGFRCVGMRQSRMFTKAIRPEDLELVV